jgi:hypothetical protein
LPLSGEGALREFEAITDPVKCRHFRQPADRLRAG